jgi:hypothetical protein
VIELIVLSENKGEFPGSTASITFTYIVHSEAPNGKIYYRVLAHPICINLKK